MSLHVIKSKSILVVGIGNPLRCDDGIGPYVAGCIKVKGLKRVAVWERQQLYVEDLQDMLEYKTVILVDASSDGPPLDIRLVKTSSRKALSSSHHVSVDMFAGLARSLYHRTLHWRLCSIRGKNFNVGDKISDDVLTRAHEAIERICLLTGVLISGERAKRVEPLKGTVPTIPKKP